MYNSGFQLLEYSEKLIRGCLNEEEHTVQTLVFIRIFIFVTHEDQEDHAETGTKQMSQIQYLSQPHLFHRKLTNRWHLILVSVEKWAYVILIVSNHKLV